MSEPACGETSRTAARRRAGKPAQSIGTLGSGADPTGYAGDAHCAVAAAREYPRTERIAPDARIFAPTIGLARSQRPIAIPARRRANQEERG